MVSSQPRMTASPTDARPYHHGDLREAVLRATLAAVELHGASGVTVRGVAKRAGVSHAAVLYHFRDKAGLFGAVAAEGYRQLAGALDEARQSHPGRFLELGVAYVMFAVGHRAHFEVMYRPELYRADDPEVVAARASTAPYLYGTDRPDADQLQAGVAAWSFVHGLATLWL